MSKYQECELQVLRDYVPVEDNYPASWEDFLHEKKKCVMKFAEEVHECSHQFIWDFGEESNYDGHNEEAARMGDHVVKMLFGE